LIFEKEREIAHIETQIEDQVARIHRLHEFAEPEVAPTYFALARQSLRRIDELTAHGSEVADQLMILDGRLHNYQNQLRVLNGEPTKTSVSRNRRLEFQQRVFDLKRRLPSEFE